VKGKKISSKIQKENCEIEINECLIKCLQNLTLCQVVNHSSTHLAQTCARKMSGQGWGGASALDYMWGTLGGDPQMRSALGPTSVIRLSWVSAVLLTHCVVLGELFPFAGPPFFIYQMKRTTS
jgi:hypothetical protein